MTEQEIKRAKLYARSAAWAEANHSPKLRDVFTRRGIAIAGDYWPHLYADRDADGVTSLPEPEPAPEPTKAQAKAAEALTRECAKCGAKPGAKCSNYTGANCAPHSGR